MLDITLIPVLSDNYIFLLHEKEAGITAAVDPAEAAPVLQCLSAKSVPLTYILNTHHHWDHVGGNIRLKQETGCHIVGYSQDAARIPGIDIQLNDNDHFSFGNETVNVITLPGHTIGHIAYFFPESKALFCGDTLFSLGCGRLFEGTPEQMLHSLTKLAQLPGDTHVYCAHEYTQSNAEFALTLEPNNLALQQRYAQIRELRKNGQPTIPSTIALECQTNPFLRADSPEIRTTLRIENATSLAVFTEIRKRKDSF